MCRDAAVVQVIQSFGQNLQLQIRYIIINYLSNGKYWELIKKNNFQISFDENNLVKIVRIKLIHKSNIVCMKQVLDK